jgi:hypothetical protein
MGGNAFPKPAKRLSTAQLDLLKAHAVKAIEPFFIRIAPLNDVRSKANHGDLDIICGWENERTWNWKGEDRGIVGPEGGDGMGGKIVSVTETEARGAEPVEGENAEEKEKRELRVWLFDIAAAAGAKEWVRRGPEISLAIPCAVFGEATSEHAHDPNVSRRIFIRNRGYSSCSRHFTSSTFPLSRPARLTFTILPCRTPPLSSYSLEPFAAFQPPSPCK